MMTDVAQDITNNTILNTMFDIKTKTQLKYTFSNALFGDKYNNHVRKEYYYDNN